MRSKMKKQLKWIVLGVMCIVIGSGLGVFYQLDQKKNPTIATGEESMDKVDSQAVWQDIESSETIISGDEETQEIALEAIADADEKNTEIEDATTVGQEHFVVLDDEVYVYTDDIQTILFLGTDESGNPAEAGKEYHGAMADMLMLLIINHTNKEYTVLQLNRDTIANIHLIDANGEGEACADIQLCTAHWYGGNDKMNCENTVRAVSELLGGVAIDTYYCLDWEGIKTLNHVVDGVTLTIQNDFSNVDSALVYGDTVTLTDEQALVFLRYRYGVDDGENLGRMDRHQQYLNAWLATVKERTTENQAFPAMVYQELNPYATTNFKGKDIGSQFNQISAYVNRGIVTFEGEFEIGKALGDGIEHMEFYVDEENKIDLLSQLYHLLITEYDAEDFEDEE